MTLLDGLIDKMLGKPAGRRRFGYPPLLQQSCMVR